MQKTDKQFGYRGVSQGLVSSQTGSHKLFCILQSVTGQQNAKALSISVQSV